MIFLVSSCGGGGETSSTPTTTVNTVTLASSQAPSVIASDAAACTTSGSTVIISGTVSYERVPLSAVVGNGLDYNNIQTLPIRAADIQLLGPSDCVMASGVTSTTGTYSLAAAVSTQTKVRVKARTANTVGATWDFEVRDNTQSNGLYVLDGSAVDSGTSSSTRNLTATSGWTGVSYGGIRASAPFSLLDTVYTSLQTVVAVDNTAVMDDADIFWSVNNSTASGTLSNGEIGGSFYSNDQIYILGDDNSDTDEFDQHVVAHEWGHYFEDNLSRSDSIGGSHSITSLLDMRLALSEGFGNAFSGIALGDPVYRDTGGNQQSSDQISVSVETNAVTNIGWFNEGSVQTIIYDVFDSVGDANDSVSLGFAPIYNAMTSATYTGQASRTNIFSWVDIVRNANPASSASINTLVSSQSISSTANIFGDPETNNGGDARNLEVFKPITDNGVPVQVCSYKDNGEFNALGNRRLMLLDVTGAGSKTVTVSRVSGLASSDPDIRLYLDSAFLTVSQLTTVNSETFTRNFLADQYVLEVYEFSNVDGNTGGGDVCFNVTVT